MKLTRSSAFQITNELFRLKILSGFRDIIVKVGQTLQFQMRFVSKMALQNSVRTKIFISRPMFSKCKKCSITLERFIQNSRKLKKCLKFVNIYKNRNLKFKNSLSIVRLTIL